MLDGQKSPQSRKKAARAKMSSQFSDEDSNQEKKTNNKEVVCKFKFWVKTVENQVENKRNTIK